MKTALFVSLASALALMTLIPSSAGAVGAGKQCGTIVGIQCDAGLFCQKKPGQCNIIDAAGTCVKVPKICRWVGWASDHRSRAPRERQWL